MFHRFYLCQFTYFSQSITLLKKILIIVLQWEKITITRELQFRYPAACLIFNCIVVCEIVRASSRTALYLNNWFRSSHPLGFRSKENRPLALTIQRLAVLTSSHYSRYLAFRRDSCTWFEVWLSAKLANLLNADSCLLHKYFIQSVHFLLSAELRIRVTLWCNSMATRQ